MSNKSIKFNKRKGALIFCTMILFTCYLSLLGLLEGQALGNVNTYERIIVKKGDTVWMLAKRYGPQNQDIRKTIHQIKTTNKLGNRYIQPGELLIIPK